jgi:hypothetical protein
MACQFCWCDSGLERSLASHCEKGYGLRVGSVLREREIVVPTGCLAHEIIPNWGHANCECTTARAAHGVYYLEIISYLLSYTPKNNEVEKKTWYVAFCLASARPPPCPPSARPRASIGVSASASSFLPSPLILNRPTHYHHPHHPICHRRLSPETLHAAARPLLTEHPLSPQRS